MEIAACLHCKKPVLRTTAVDAVLDIEIDGRLVEQVRLFYMHPGCADLKAVSRMNRLERLYKKRGGTVRRRLERSTPG